MAGKPKQMERDGLGEAIMKARLKAGLTQADLAKALGIPQSHVARYEKDGRIRHQQRLAQIAKLLNTTTDHLLGLDEPFTYYQIKDGVMRKFIDFVDQGIEQLPEGEAQQIADVVNLMIDQALKRQSNGTQQNGKSRPPKSS